MSKEKRSFFERLTGTVKIEEEKKHHDRDDDLLEAIDDGEDRDGQLTVDVYQTSDMIIIKTMVAGVRPEDLDINITRDMVTIKGKREEERGIRSDDYFIRELYWGSFSRTIVLPQEIEVEESDAVEKHGLLIIKLPKVNKGKQTKLKVKTLG